MNKKLLSVILVLMLLVCLTTCLISCNKEDTNDTNTSEGGSSFKVIDGASLNVHPGAQIIVKSSDRMSESEVLSGISLKDNTTSEATSFRVVAMGNNQFRVTPLSQFTVGNHYQMRLLDKRLSYVDYNSEILFLTIIADDVLERELGADVIEVNGGDYISNPVSNGNLNMFTFDSARAGVELSMGKILYADNKAYQIAGVAESNEVGCQKVSYVTPAYDKVYNKLTTSTTAALDKGKIEYADEEATEEIVNLVSCAGFDVGPVRVDANKVGDNTVRLSIVITVKDVLGDKDGINSLDLELSFRIDSQVAVETNINIGSVVGNKSNIDITADFYNTLTFGVAVKDGATVSESSELDAIIAKIKAMVQNSNEDIVTIPVFNWVVPIGNGVADVRFQVNAALDLAFSGKLGVEASATSGFKAEIKYNPATDEKTAKITETQGLSFDATTVYFDGNATIYLGVNATIKFDLLGGVISAGIGAEVGNYNKIYGTIGTTNLLEDDISAVYGYYFEGGIYYDVKFLYSVAKIASGEKSFFNGRQENKLYDAGDPVVITEAAVDGLVYIDDTAKDLDITISTKNLVTGEEITGIKLEDFTKIEDITDDNIIVENGTIKIVGELTAETTKIKVDSIEITLSVSAIKVIAADTDVGTLDAGEYRLPDGTIVIVE